MSELLRLCDLKVGDLVANFGAYSGAQAYVDKVVHGVTSAFVYFRWSFCGLDYIPSPKLWFGKTAAGTDYLDPPVWELLERDGQPVSTAKSLPEPEEQTVRRLSRRPRPSKPKENGSSMRIGTMDLATTSHLFKDVAAYQSFVGEIRGTLANSPRTLLMADGEIVCLLLDNELTAQHLASELTSRMGNPEFAKKLSALLAEYPDDGSS